MKLPFTHEQFLELFGKYNREVAPVIALLWLGTVAALILLYRRQACRSRVISVLLVLHWAWSGAGYHFTYFSRINPAAILFGAVFLLQAGLLLWRGTIRRCLVFTPTASVWGWLGGALICYALLYPAIGLLLGLTYPRLPLFGVPCPTTILTAGLLLLAPRREARILGGIPILWALVGGSAAFVLSIHADLVLLLAGVLLLGYQLKREQAE